MEEKTKRSVIYQGVERLLPQCNPLPYEEDLREVVVAHPSDGLGIGVHDGCL